MRWLIFFSLFFCYGNQSFADLSERTYARVISDRAILYTNADMTDSVGYLTRGKILMVGPEDKLKNDIYPIYHRGKTLFIEKKNILISKDKNRIFNSPRNILKKMDAQDYQGRLSLGASFFSFTNSKTDQTGTPGLDEALSGAGAWARLSFQLNDDWYARGALFYDSMNLGEESTEGQPQLSYLGIGGGASYRILSSEERDLWVLLAFADFNFSFNANIDNPGNWSIYGNMIGLQAGLETVYRFHESIGAELSASYEMQNFSGFDVPFTEDELQATLSGIRIALGLTIFY